MDRDATVEYYDKHSGETFNIPIYNVEPYELKEKHNRSVYKAICVSINLLADRPDLNTMPCFQINDVIFEIDRSSYENNLKECITYFTSTEEYEICAKLVLLGNKM